MTIGDDSGTITPPDMRISLLVWAATPGSWVTMIIVFPSTSLRLTEDTHYIVRGLTVERTRRFVGKYD